MTELEETSAMLQKEKDDGLCAEIEQIKKECQLNCRQIESHLLNGCRIPPNYLKQWQEATDYDEKCSTAVGIFSGLPFTEQLNTQSSNVNLKKSTNVPSAGGIKTPGLRKNNSRTRKKNTNNVEQQEPTGAEILPKAVEVFAVSQNDFKIHRTIPAKEINKWTDINISRMKKPSNVSTPAKLACATDVTVNGADTSNQELQNLYFQRQQSTSVTNKLTQCEHVTNKTAKYSGNTSRDQVSNSNHPPLSCQYSIQSGMYTPDSAVDYKMASDNIDSFHLKLRSSAQRVVVDTQTSDTMAVNRSLAEDPVFYQNPQQNIVHYRIPITSELTTKGTTHSKAMSSTYTPHAAKILNTAQNQLQRHLQVANMPTQGDSMVKSTEMMCVSDQVFFNKSQRQNHQTFQQTTNVLTPSRSVSTAASPYRGVSVSTAASPYQGVSVSTAASPYRGVSVATAASPYRGVSVATAASPYRGVSVATAASPYRAESVGFRVLHLDSLEPVLQYPTQTASLHDVSVLEPSVAASYQGSTQNTQFTGLCVVGSDIAASYPPDIAQVSGFTVTQPDNATLRQDPVQKSHASGPPLTQLNTRRSSQYHPQIAQLPGLAETQPYIVTSSHPTQKGQLSSLPASQSDIEISKQHLAQKAQRSSLSLNQSDKATSRQHLAQKAQRPGVYVTQTHIATSSQQFAQKPQWSSLPPSQPDKVSSGQRLVQKSQLSGRPVVQPYIPTSSQAVSTNVSQAPQQISDSTTGECFYNNPFIDSPSTGPQIQQTLQSTTEVLAPCQNVQAALVECRMPLASCTSSTSPVISHTFHLDNSPAVNADYNDNMYKTSSPSLIDFWLDNTSQ